MRTLLIALTLVTVYGCGDQHWCRVNAIDLSIDAQACMDLDVAAKAIKVLEKRKKASTSGFEKKLDAMLGSEVDNTACKGRMADLAANLRSGMNDCVKRNKMYMQEIAKCEAKVDNLPECAEQGWKKPR